MCINISKRDYSANDPTEGQKHSYFFFSISHLHIMKNLKEKCDFLLDYLNTKAQPVILIRKIASAIKLLTLAFPLLSVDLKGISPIHIFVIVEIIN